MTRIYRPVLDPSRPQTDLTNLSYERIDMTMQIKSRFDGHTLYKCKAEAMLSALQTAVKAGADLRGAYLSGADLSGADLSGADLSGAKINWQSHDMIAEILRREAGDDIDRRMVAGLILVSRDWCWQKFLAIDRPLKEWAIETLRKYVVAGDNTPDILTAKGMQV